MTGHLWSKCFRQKMSDEISGLRTKIRVTNAINPKPTGSPTASSSCVFKPLSAFVTGRCNVNVCQLRAARYTKGNHLLAHIMRRCHFQRTQSIDAIVVRLIVSQLAQDIPIYLSTLSTARTLTVMARATKRLHSPSCHDSLLCWRTNNRACGVPAVHYTVVQ